MSSDEEELKARLDAEDLKLQQEHARCLLEVARTGFNAEVSNMVSDLAHANLADQPKSQLASMLKSLENRVADGDLPAKMVLATLKIRGDMVARDELGALDLLEDIAGRPEAIEANALLARIHRENGSYVKAMKYAEVAATAGSSVGMVELGTMHAQGQGVEVDLLTAARWFKRAHESGSIDGTDNWAWHLGKGLGITANPHQAAQIYEKLNERRPESSNYATNAATMYGLCDPALVPDCGAKRQRWLAIAAGKGSAMAQQIVAGQVSDAEWSKLNKFEVNGVSLEVFERTGKVQGVETQRVSNTSGFGGANNTPVRIQTSHSAWQVVSVGYDDGEVMKINLGMNKTATVGRTYRVMYAGHAGTAKGYPYSLLDQDGKTKVVAHDAETMFDFLKVPLPPTRNGALAMSLIVSIVTVPLIFSQFFFIPLLFFALCVLIIRRLMERNKILASMEENLRACERFWLRGS